MALGAVVVAQLVERSLTTPEVHSSKPAIGNYTVYCINENKEK